MSTVVTHAVARLLLGPILVVSLAILVKGYAEVGDGFSAGAVAALGILLQYLTFGRERTEAAMPLRRLPATAFVGLLLGLAIAAWPLLRGDPLLTHAPAPGAEVVKLGTLELVTAVAFDVAVFMLVVGAMVGILHAVAAAREER